jgi:hypothetical protein
VDTVFWQDHMKTYRFHFNTGEVRARDGIPMKHISTGNFGKLQIEASQLLETIQADVLLQRDSGICLFLLSFPSPKTNNDLGGSSYVYKADHDTLPTKLPAPLMQAKELMLHNATWYGECEGLMFDSIFPMAWFAAGSKKVVTFRSHRVLLVI